MGNKLGELPDRLHRRVPSRFGSGYLLVTNQRHEREVERSTRVDTRTCLPHPDLHGQIEEVGVAMLHPELAEEHANHFATRCPRADRERFVLTV